MLHVWYSINALNVRFTYVKRPLHRAVYSSGDKKINYKSATLALHWLSCSLLSITKIYLGISVPNISFIIVFIISLRYAF